MFGSLFKGWLGEKVTQFGLWHHLNDQTYRRIHDVIVTARNGTTQNRPRVGVLLRQLRGRNEELQRLAFRR